MRSVRLRAAFGNLDASGLDDVVEQLVEVGRELLRRFSGPHVQRLRGALACCSDVRSGNCGSSTSSPNMSRSSLMRNWCSTDWGLTRFTMMPSG